MYVVFVTGGLASGKDTTCSLLAELGATVLDLDVVAKEEQEDSFVLERLEEVFGEDVVDDYGRLNRRLLARRAFASRESADVLNAICWPAVKERVATFIRDARRRPAEGGLLVIQIPLLAEAPDFLDMKDEVIAVSAPEELRFERAVARGMDPADARRRLALQAGDAEREAISDTVFDNGNTPEALKAQVTAWHANRASSGLF
jgi:dephospho-CoA kinase